MNCARKHTLVTGSSSGIGRATALRFAAAGQHVYAGVRKPANGDRLVRSAARAAGCPSPCSTWRAGASSGCPPQAPSPPDRGLRGPGARGPGARSQPSPAQVGQQQGRWPARRGTPVVPPGLQHAAVTAGTGPASASYDVDAATMHMERHERGIHAL